jgi:hypothetical protein
MTVSTATSVKGTAHGTIPVTANPNIANGTGGTAATNPNHGHDADDKPGAAKQVAADTHTSQSTPMSHSTAATHAMITMHDLMHAEAVAHQMHWA